MERKKEKKNNKIYSSRRTRGVHALCYCTSMYNIYVYNCANTSVSYPRPFLKYRQQSYDFDLRVLLLLLLYR